VNVWPTSSSSSRGIGSVSHAIDLAAILSVIGPTDTWPRPFQRSVALNEKGRCGQTKVVSHFQICVPLVQICVPLGAELLHFLECFVALGRAIAQFRYMPLKIGLNFILAGEIAPHRRQLDEKAFEPPPHPFVVAYLLGHCVRSVARLPVASMACYDDLNLVLVSVEFSLPGRCARRAKDDHASYSIVRRPWWMVVTGFPTSRC